jgi:hypothetical protein
LLGQKRKTSADVAEFNALPATQSADLPVRPFGAKLAEPALAAGAPPDAPGATPASGLVRLLALSVLCIAAPIAAARPVANGNHVHAACPKKHSAPAVAAATPARPAARQVIFLNGGGGGIGHWGRIAADLMP